jgi:hypothetical protein
MAGPGRPPKQPEIPTRVRDASDIEKARKHSVKAMASTKTSHKAIADMLEISQTELRRRYASELKHGLDYVYAKVSLKLVQGAMSGDMRAMLAWMRHCGGWQEVSRREITGKDGQPINIQHLDDIALSQIIGAIRSTKLVGRSRGRTGSEIEADTSDVVDMDSVSGSADEGDEE